MNQIKQMIVAIVVTSAIMYGLYALFVNALA